MVIARKRASPKAKNFDETALLPGLFPEEFPPEILLPFKSTYSTHRGAIYTVDALEAMKQMPQRCIDLLITSPPYALHFKKEYGNAEKEEYVNWFRPFAQEIHRVLKPEGSFVLNIGGSYNAGRPTRSLYHFRVLLMLCDEIGFHLAQECFWYNPAKLPSPAEWVNVRRIRIKDSVEYIWWLSKIPEPKADNRKVLEDYSPDMVRLLRKGYRAKERPSGHKITNKFKDRGGSIPSNLIERGNNESNSEYIRLCGEYGFKPHPTRFPAALPEFYMKFLTEPGDLVLDPFAGSNTTGAVAERFQRRWLAFEMEPRYVESSKLRFGLVPDAKKL
ncbi:MAG: site-specific DNA-methyltransferase [Planctomycetes bacterium]|nr:site-specific DNA-methyltransferase [Planctomycetota bacterium]